MSTETTTPELKTYNGNCHCGAFKFHITIPELTAVNKCNCSICFRKGYRWVFPPAGGFVIERGENALKDYEFGKGTMSHRFCGRCGTGVMGKRHGVEAGRDIGVNVNALLDVDVFALEVSEFDGKALEPQFIAPKFTGEEPKPTIEITTPKTYNGSCHCGATTLSLLSNGPLPDGGGGMQACDCSICVHNGTILVYPHPSQISISSVPDSVTAYEFGRKFVSHDFCGTCGVAIQLRKLDVGKERWEVEHKGVPYERHFNMLPVNARLFERVEWESFEVPKGNWSKKGEKYVCPE